MAAVERALDAAGAERRRRRGLRPRHDGGHQRAAGGHRRAHRVRRHRRLHRRRRPRPPGAARALPPVRRAPRAADAARAALRRARAHRARRRARAADATSSALVDAVAGAEPEAVAVCLLHSYRHPDHERAIGDALRERLGRPRLAVARGRRDLPRVRARGDHRGRRRPLPPAGALPAPAARRVAATPACPTPAIMQSSGGLAALDAAADHAALTVLSGPAGGAAAAALLAERCGEPDLLCFDMGGTSCDVCVVEGGRVRETTAREVGGRPLALPMVDIHTVGAGGGSIGWRDPGGALRVGPRSAGAEPGPACYGRGGTEPTVTDANLVLGHLSADVPLAGDVDARRRRGARGRRARWPASSGSTSRACAEGIVRVANAEMVRALRVMTVERGIDPRRFALLAFGGAGPLHAAAIARGARDDADPRPARLGRAQRARPGRRRPPRRRPAHGPRRRRRERRRAAPTRSARRWAASRRSRSPGTCATAASRTSSPCAARERDELRERFEALHEERYGHRDPDGEVELVTVRVTGAPARRRRSTSARRPASRSAGPTVVALPEATLVVPEGWSGTHRRHRHARAGARGMSVDPIALQVTAGALRAACEEMGAVLVRSAHSANIKERRDCSTALFDAAGEMVMQAEHIPVHLGAMPAAVAAVRDRDHADGRLVGPQRPLRRRHPPARHHGRHARLPRRRAARLRRRARPPRRRRRARAGLDAGRLDDARGGGRRHRAARARRRGDRRARRRRCASPRTGAPTCAPSSPPTAPAPGAWASWPIASALEFLREATAAVLDYAERRTRACLADARRRDPHRRRPARGGRGRPRAARGRHGRRRRADARLLGLGRPARRQPQLPAGGDGERVPVRRARAHRPRHPAQRGRLPARSPSSRPRARCSTRARPPRSPAATSRPPRAWPTSCSAPSAARSARGR